MTSKLHIAPREFIQESISSGLEVAFLCGHRKVVTAESLSAPPRAKCRRCKQLHKALVKTDLADPEVAMAKASWRPATYSYVFRIVEVTEFPYLDEKDAS